MPRAFLQRVLLAMLLCVLRCYATTRRVPQDYATIQTALNAVVNGDTVLVALGTYAESLHPPVRTFVMRGDVAPDTGDYPRPVIDPTTLPRSDTLACLYTMNGATQVYEDLVFRNRVAMYANRPFGVTGGIHSSGQRTFRRCLFDSTYMGLWSEAGAVTLDQCTFRNINRFAFNGVFGSLAALNCEFSGHTTGPPMVQASSGTEIRRCSFRHCYQAEALALSAGDLVEDCLFDSCGPQIFYLVDIYSFAGTIQHNVFSNNLLAGTTLGVDVVCGDTVRIVGNLFTNNVAFNGYANIGLTMMPTQSDSLGNPIRCFGGVVDSNLFAYSVAGGAGSNAITAYDPGIITHNRLVQIQSSDAADIATTFDGSILRSNLFVDEHYAMLSPAQPHSADARWNWWGDSTGPYDPARNPDGTGSLVGGGLDYAPWCTDTLNCEEPSSTHDRNLVLHPTSFRLSAYPNPFNATTRIRLEAPSPFMAEVTLFNVLGRKVRDLWTGPLAYDKDLELDGKDLASGMYVVRVSDVIGNRPVATTKIVILR